MKNKFDCDDKISELGERIFKLKKKRQELLKSNNKPTKNYKPKDEYDSDELYIGVMEDMDVPDGFLFNSSELYLFDKIDTKYYTVGTDIYGLSEENASIYREIFTGVKSYPYDDSHYVFESNKVHIISSLKDAMDMTFIDTPKKIKKNELLGVFDLINRNKRELIDNYNKNANGLNKIR